mmetsp:Transcript_5244/g.14974  ORF Transcript_5244/g.14974 Transcript_5244/m.14974 type:complete len:200 (-) Transcript_5244:123-722(-)
MGASSAKALCLVQNRLVNLGQRDLCGRYLALGPLRQSICFGQVAVLRPRRRMALLGHRNVLMSCAQSLQAVVVVFKQRAHRMRQTKLEAERPKKLARAMVVQILQIIRCRLKPVGYLRQRWLWLVATGRTILHRGGVQRGWGCVQLGHRPEIRAKSGHLVALRSPHCNHLLRCVYHCLDAVTVLIQFLSQLFNRSQVDI